MRKLRAILVICVLLGLDWVVLHDIFKRNEPSYLSEYSFLIGSIPLILLAFFWLSRKRTTVLHGR